MGRKKGGKNPEGHRAGGARTGAGRPRKAGPLTLKASIRVHAHQPAADHSTFVRRDAIHPALQAFIELPANYIIRCSKCGHDDQSCLLVSVPSEPEENPVPSALVSRSQSPRDEVAPVADFAYTDPSPLITPPQSVSPGASSSTETELHQEIPLDESVVHAESLLLLSTPISTTPASVNHQTYDLEPQELTQAPPHPHSNMMQPAHLDQPDLPYDPACFQDFLQQDNHGAHTAEQYTGPDPQQYRMYDQQQQDHFPTSPSFQPGPSESSPTQYYPPNGQQSEYPQQQQFYAPAPSYPPAPAPDMYLSLQQPQQLIKPGPAAWRHAPHSTSLPAAAAAILSPHHTHPQTHNLDPSGPVQFLPTGQHTQRRRRRCVVCIGAGRGEDADRCCGRGNRHLCPWYQRHGSPENIMEIRNAKELRPATAT